MIVGNYRCSLAGQDLNRVWNEPSRKLHPTIHALKTLAKQFMEEREVSPASLGFHGDKDRGKAVHTLSCRLKSSEFSFRRHSLSMSPCHQLIHAAICALAPRYVQVALFCDLHGHSRKKGIFIYG